MFGGDFSGDSVSFRLLKASFFASGDLVFVGLSEIVFNVWRFWFWRVSLCISGAPMLSFWLFKASFSASGDLVFVLSSNASFPTSEDSGFVSTSNASFPPLKILVSASFLMFLQVLLC